MTVEFYTMGVRIDASSELTIFGREATLTYVTYTGTGGHLHQFDLRFHKPYSEYNHWHPGAAVFHTQENHPTYNGNVYLVEGIPYPYWIADRLADQFKDSWKSWATDNDSDIEILRAKLKKLTPAMDSGII